MKLKLFLTVFSLLLGLAFSEVWEKSAQAPSEPVAFTAHSTQLGYGPEGFVPLTIVKTFALRSDGSYYEEQTNIDHKRNGSLTTLVIRDKSTARKTVVHPSVKMITSYKFKSQNFLPTGLGCTQHILTASDAGEFLGYRVVETVQESTLGADFLKERSLYAPELNCLLIYSELEKIDSNSKLVFTNIYRVNQITLGEPDPALFEIPRGYTESLPSQAMKMEFEATGRVDAADVQNFLTFYRDRFAKADADYFSKKYEP